MPSDALAAMASTNPVVIRRTMAGLREAGLVTSAKGHGGGWALARPLAEITMLDVHRALGGPEVFALGTAMDAPRCGIERSANARMRAAMDRAEQVLLDELEAVTLDMILADMLAEGKTAARG